VVIVHAFDLYVVGETRLAVDVAGQAVLGVEKLGVGSGGPRRTRYRNEHALEVAVESKRNFLQLN